MKLTDLKESFEATSKTVIGNNPLRHGEHSVRDVPNTDPHLVNRITDNDTAYNRYTKFLFKNKIAQNNPHFPRIYENNSYISTDKAETHPKKLLVMEKTPMTFRNFILLSNNNEQSLERIKQIANTYLNELAAEDYDQAELENDRSLDRAKIKQLEQLLLDDLTHIQNISLDSYKEALKILIDNDHIGNLNLTDTNIKIRRSTHGIQLVFDSPYQ